MCSRVLSCVQSVHQGVPRQGRRGQTRGRIACRAQAQPDFLSPCDNAFAPQVAKELKSKLPEVTIRFGFVGYRDILVSGLAASACVLHAPLHAACRLPDPRAAASLFARACAHRTVTCVTSSLRSIRASTRQGSLGLLTLQPCSMVLIAPCSAQLHSFVKTLVAKNFGNVDWAEDVAGGLNKVLASIVPARLLSLWAPLCSLLCCVPLPAGVQAGLEVAHEAAHSHGRRALPRSVRCVCALVDPVC